MPKMKPEDCKHERANAGDICPDCGTETKSELRELAEAIVDVMEERKTKKSEPTEKKKSLLERMREKK